METCKRKTRKLHVLGGGQVISVLHGAEKEVFVAKEISTYLQALSIFHAANRKDIQGISRI